MPKTTFRLSESEDRALTHAAGGESKTAFIKKCLSLHPRYAQLRLMYDGDVVDKMIGMQEPGTRANISTLSEGTIVIIKNDPYVVGPIAFGQHGHRIICHSANGSGDIQRIAAGQVVEVGSRLDKRIPPQHLVLKPVEERILHELAGGPKTLADLCSTMVDLNRFNPARMTITQGMVANFVKHMIPLLIGALVEVDLDHAKEAPWRLTSRGKQVAGRL